MSRCKGINCQRSLAAFRKCEFPFSSDIIGRQHAGTGVAERVEHGIGQRAVGSCFPVFSSRPCRARENFLAERGERHFGIFCDRASGPVNASDDVLCNGRGRPKKFSGLTVKRIDDTGFPWNSGYDLPSFTGLKPWINPTDL